MPEVQAHAERLDITYAGAALERFTPIAFTALKTFDPDPATTHGEQLLGVGRRGKALLLRFPSATHVVHLMQGGRLKPDEKQAAKPRNGQARWRFSDGRALLLTEAGTERKAGVWVVAGDPGDAPPLADLGPEAVELDVEAMRTALSEKNGRLHGFLRDQRRIAGLGRRLANEICHRAKLSPFAMTASLATDEIERLVDAVSEAVAEGLAFERQRDDMSSSKDRPGAVHHRTGDPCSECGDEVREVAYNRYTVHYCATCQTGGTVLADNTTSKFLK